MNTMKRGIIIFCLLFSLFSCRHISAQDSTSFAVSAIISPKKTDFQFELTSSSNNTSVGENMPITYKVTYGSKLTHPASITLEVLWDQSKLQGNGASFSDLVNYVDNSATNAYGSSSPIIDSVSKKITWHINSFPGKTLDQTVFFTLSTNGNYTGKAIIPIIVKAQMIGDVINMDSLTTTSYFDYSIKPTTAPVSTSVSTTITPTPTGMHLDNIFQSITIKSITSNDAVVSIETFKESLLKIEYGMSSTKFNNLINTEYYLRNSDIELENLHPDTQYFFYVTATDLQGNKITSDIYLVITASESIIPNISSNSLIVTSDNTLLVDPTITSTSSAQPKPVIVIPSSNAFSFKFRLDKKTRIKKVKLLIRNKNVLGINTTEFNQIIPNSNEVDAIELSSGQFIGRIFSPKNPGSYEIYIRISDEAGNIVEEKIADLNITHPFTVITNDHLPIEGAQVTIYYFNPRTQQYEMLPPEIFSIKNPDYTNNNGEITSPLPSGKYLAKVTAIGYSQKDINFTLGPNNGEVYPMVNLESQPFNITSTSSYYWTIVKDVIQDSKIYIQGLSNSSRFFKLNALVIIILLILLTLLSLSSRLQIPVHSLWEYFIHHKEIALFNNKLRKIIKGTLFNENTSMIVVGADIYLMDVEKNKVVAHTKTNKKGEFKLVKLTNRIYEIHIMKNGFEPIILNEAEIKPIELGRYLVRIKKKAFGPRLVEKVLATFSVFLSLFFEGFLILSFIFEISLGYSLGWYITFPFFIFSLINLSLWFVHLWHLKTERNILF